MRTTYSAHYHNSENREYNWIHILGKRLKTVVARSGTIEFEYLDERLDLQRHPNYHSGNVSDDIAPKSLNGIKISSGTHCKRWRLSYDYFEDNSVGSAPHGKRLQLTQVQEQDCSGSTLIPPHSFTYDRSMGSQTGPIYLPHRLSKRVDHWGFFNNASQNDNLIVLVPEGTTLDLFGDEKTYGEANRSSSEATKQGMLTKHTYPTGGFTSYEYELNTVPEKLYSDPVDKFTITNCTDATVADCCDHLTPSQQMIALTASERDKAQILLQLFDV
jgi:hypothetical protein